PTTYVTTSRSENGDRNVQSFVKIDVSKINQQNTTETPNVTISTPPGETSTAGTTAASTIGSSTLSSGTKTTESSTGRPSSTPSAATTTETVPPIDLNPQVPLQGRAAKLIPTGYYCRCDLKINVCDVNCCCDIDCSEAILKVFNCDQEQLHTEEYHHGEGLQSCRVQGGLLCLVEPIHEEGDERHYDPNQKADATKHRWKDVFPLDVTVPEEARLDHYRVDDPIHFYNETSETVETFALPYSLTNGACQIEQPVQFLRDRINRCRRRVDDLTTVNRQFLHQLITTGRFFRSPKTRAATEHPCMGDDCLNVTYTVSVCYTAIGEGGWNCTQNSTSDAAGLVELSDEEYDTSCPTIVIKFNHNFTNLLTIEAKLLCQRMDTGDDSEYAWQRITVKFVAQPISPKRNNVTYRTSGNLGYLPGKPLLVTPLELPPNGTHDTGSPKTMLAFFTNGTRQPDESFRLRLPVSRRNRCRLSSDEHETINFGVDSWHRCNFIPPDAVTNATGGRNYTRFCGKLQESIYSHLLHGVRSDGEGRLYENLNLYVSKYGNPVNRTSEWVRVRTVNVRSEAVAETTAADEYFSCSNMHINVDYRIFFAVERVRNVRYQAIVHEVEIVFGPRVNLRFRQEEDIRVPIFVQVQFLDLTSSSSPLKSAVMVIAVGGLCWCAALL
ncbi:tectonic, partial [Anopheles bellator]|uniref:tectonic n=1 Tax=Anopheles bellator TaxID=139047 RepID=UPI0026488522